MTTERQPDKSSTPSARAACYVTDWPMVKEMIAQAKLGHTQFCAGMHIHEGGEAEAEWISWDEAFAELVREIQKASKHGT